MEDAFAEDALPMADFGMKGLVESFKLNLWDGFHEILIGNATKMMEGEASDDTQEMVKKMLLALPFYMLSMTGKVDFKMDNAAIAEMMKLPEAEMSKMNVHSLLSMMTPLGSLDDLELIQNCEKLWPIVWPNNETAKCESIEQYCNMFVDKFLPIAKFAESREEPGEGYEWLRREKPC
jgi:hypothetical protein